MKYVPPLNGDTADLDRSWVNADPDNGVAGSRLNAPALEDPQREILAVIAAGGLAPDDGDLTQLLKAIQVIVASGLSSRLANMFAPSATSPVSMKVNIAAGHVFTDGAITEVAAQQTATLVAPVGNPRIDRIVIDRATGVFSVVAGTPAAAPVAPAIPSGKNPVAKVTLTVGQATITAASITDERDLFSLGLGLAAFLGLGADIVGASGNLTMKQTLVSQSANFPFAAADRNKLHRFAGSAKTATLLAAATAGDGWAVALQDAVGGNIVASPATNLYVNGGSAVASYTFAAGEWGVLRTNGADYVLTTNLQPSALRSGFTGTVVSYGTKSSGTLTPSPADGGNIGAVVNGGAFTLAAPTLAGVYTLILDIYNNASAGAITLSGFTKVDGIAFSTTNALAYRCYISKGSNGTHINVAALQ